ncbi:MAG: flagellar motor protein MotB, partial [Bdellovibrionia bacterium]
MRLLRRPKVIEDLSTDTDGTWIISYADMITLLLSFFIIYFTIDRSTGSTEKPQETQQQEMIQ